MKLQSFKLFLENNLTDEIEEITREDFNDANSARNKFKPEELEKIESLLLRRYGVSLYVGTSEEYIAIGYKKHSMDIITDGDYHLYIKEEITDKGTFYYYTKIDIGFGFEPFKEFLSKYSRIKKF